MEPFISFSVLVGGRHQYVADADVSKYNPSKLAKWTIEYKEPENVHEFSASRYALNLGLITTTGAQDAQAVYLAKGESYAKDLITGGQAELPNGTTLVITKDSAPSLVPKSILRRFALLVENGRLPTAEEWDELKNG